MLWEGRRAEKGGGLSSRGKDWKLKDLENKKGLCLLEKRGEERRSRENGRLSFCVQGCRRSFYTMG